jgi:uncharacterized glyoxalase superfamily protein PhnB
MTAARSVSSSVEVATDPLTAFTVFTEEIDCWWVQGPINFYDSARAYSKRIEPGVGGRVMEIYDESTGDGLEVARITAWEPGARLAWRSSVDDVETEVTFDKIGAGTLVRVEATIPEGGKDIGGTSFVRVTPIWFGPWVAKRDRVAHRPLAMARLALGVHYARPAAAAQWLHDVFGFEPSSNMAADDEDHTWIEFHLGNSSLMVFKRSGELSEGAPVTHTPWVFVDDLDAHYCRAKAGGARVVEEIWQHGARAYGVLDLEGNHWTFAQASPLMR